MCKARNDRNALNEAGPSELGNDSCREAKIDLVGREAFEQDGIKIFPIKLIRIETGVEVVHLSQSNGKLMEDFEIESTAERKCEIVASYGGVRGRRRHACKGARTEAGSIPTEQGMHKGS